MPQSPTDSPSHGPHLAADPAGLARSASRLRGLVPSAPAHAGPAGSLLDDAAVPVPDPDSGVARFLAALASASRAQETRVAALGRYAGGAAGALDWFAGEVADAEDSSSARFGREGGVIA